MNVTSFCVITDDPDNRGLFSGMFASILSGIENGFSDPIDKDLLQLAILSGLKFHYIAHGMAFSADPGYAKLQDIDRCVEIICISFLWNEEADAHFRENPHQNCQCWHVDLVRGVATNY